MENLPGLESHARTDTHTHIITHTHTHTLSHTHTRQVPGSNGSVSDLHGFPMHEPDAIENALKGVVNISLLLALPLAL